MFNENTDAVRPLCWVANQDTEMEGYDNAVSQGAWETHGITECCAAHDECYGTCGKPKKTCDRKLAQCMAKKCGGDEQCTASTRHMMEYAHAAGCGEFTRLQRDGCDCGDSHKPGQLPPSIAMGAAGVGAAAGKKENETKRVGDGDDTGEAKGETEEDENEDEDDAKAIAAQMKRDRAKATKHANDASRPAPKMSVFSTPASIPGGRYCAKLNAMSMFELEVNLDVQSSNNAFTFEVFLNGKNVVPKCRGNKYKFDAKDDSFASLAAPHPPCYRDTLKRYMLGGVKFAIHYLRATGTITVEASEVPIIDRALLRFSKQACFEGAEEFDGFRNADEAADFALHDDSEL